MANRRAARRGMYAYVRSSYRLDVCPRWYGILTMRHALLRSTSRLMITIYDFLHTYRPLTWTSVCGANALARQSADRASPGRHHQQQPQADARGQAQHAEVEHGADQEVGQGRCCGRIGRCGNQPGEPAAAACGDPRAHAVRPGQQNHREQPARGCDRGPGERALLHHDRPAASGNDELPGERPVHGRGHGHLPACRGREPGVHAVQQPAD